MNWTQEKKISFAIIVLFVLILIILLIYANSIFYLVHRLRNEIQSYKIRKLAKELGVTRPSEITQNNVKPLPTVADSDPIKGSNQAKVTIFEFSDFSCPACAVMVDPLKQIEAVYGDKIKIVWKDFPMATIHPWSEKASEAARCAGEQNKFWDYHDLLFNNQTEFSDEFFDQTAKKLNLDQQAFGYCLKSGKMTPLIQKDFDEGLNVGVDGTPYFFINGQVIPNAASFNQLKGIIDQQLQAK